MAKLSVRSTETERGPMVSVTVDGTGGPTQTQHLFIPRDLPPGVDQAAARLFAGFALFNGEAARASSTLLPELIGPHMMKAVPGLLASPYAGFVDAVGASARENKKVVADLGAVPASTVATAAIRQRAVQMFDAAPTIADKIRLPSNVFTLPQLQGLVEVDALSILPDNAQSAIMDRYLMLSYASKYGIASKYPAIATPDNPIPSGINNDAVESEAKAMITAIRALTKKIDNCSQIARDCIAYVSIACQCPVGQAFDLITKHA
ncbi:hypothetical protein QCM80_28060 [Bradyrhizobium sp. SSUT112]|uniref:hypothetical protein n=1 Tax=Bradyrhizobium sp. SSUT112 TaxID=3040604 RepID=UPI00244784A1|nr:hypothetical protein [Bradyrhizobium sp. SSUT112]MDH2354491.1 hypothetical protein [Bradyrhizobium sp. SSUT112]